MLMLLSKSLIQIIASGPAGDNDSLMKIKECTLQAQIDNLNDQIKSVQDPMLKISLASKKQELIIQRNEILHRKEG